MNAWRVLIWVATFGGGVIVGASLRSPAGVEPIDAAPVVIVADGDVEWDSARVQREIERCMSLGDRDSPDFAAEVHRTFRDHWGDLGAFLARMEGGASGLGKVETSGAIAALDLIRAGGPEAMESLQGVLDIIESSKGDVDTLPALLSLLSGMESVESGLATLLDSPEAAVRRSAVQTMSLLPGRDRSTFAECVRRGLGDADPSVRRETARVASMAIAPGTSVWDTVFPAIAKCAIADEDEETRIESQLALNLCNPWGYSDVDDLLTWMGEAGLGKNGWEGGELSWFRGWSEGVVGHLESGFNDCEDASQLLRLSAIRSAVLPVTGIARSLERMKPRTSRGRDAVIEIRHMLGIPE